MLWRSAQPVEIEIEDECEIGTQESGSVPGCQLTKPTGGGGGRGCVEQAKSQRAIHPACLRYVPDNIYEG